MRAVTEICSAAIADVVRRGWPLFGPHDDVVAANARLFECGLGDGLPLVVPTAARLQAMLGSLAAGEGEGEAGRMPPLFGEVTTAAVAYNCVLSGCTPAALPAVRAASLATLLPQFNALGLQTTTGSAAVCLIVHGPAVAALGMNAGGNCLGPGNRANACIGRALHLVLANVGGARVGVGDMATMGSPGKYTFCFAEGHHPAVVPLHVRRHCGEGDSAVTVLGISGSLEVLPAHGHGAVAGVAVPLVDAMRAARRAATGAEAGPPSEHVVLLPPEVVQRLIDQGGSMADFEAELCRRLGDEGGDDAAPVQIVCAGGVGEKMTCLQPWGGGTLSVTRRIEPCQ